MEAIASKGVDYVLLHVCGTRVVGCLIPHSTQQETRSRLTFLELLSIFYEVIMSIKGKI
jgi:hypothetical protein